jgi:hypothetical protein
VTGITRAERLAQIRRLRGGGHDRDQIARILGISYSSVGNILDDPDGSKQKERRKRYQGDCRVCGAKTDGSGGRAKAPTICAGCLRQRQYDERYWTQERIIAAIQAFAAQHGRPPFSTEWWRRNDERPTTNTVLRECGSWANAIEAAGFPRPRVGGYERTEQTRAKMRGYRVPTETYVERLRALAVDGLAPPHSDACPAAKVVGSLLWKRGISWAEACKMAGIRPRRTRGRVAA